MKKSELFEIKETLSKLSEKIEQLENEKVIENCFDECFEKKSEFAIWKKAAVAYGFVLIAALGLFIANSSEKNDVKKSANGFKIGTELRAEENISLQSENIVKSDEKTKELANPEVVEIEKDKKVETVKKIDEILDSYNEERIAKRNFYKTSCEKGSGLACYNLALINEKDSATASESEKYHIKACENGYAASCNKLGLKYYGENDDVKAFYFYDKACENKSAIGCYNAGYAALRKGKEETSLKFFTSSCEQKYFAACVAKNVVKANFKIEKNVLNKTANTCSKQNDGEACYWLGIYYEKTSDKKKESFFKKLGSNLMETKCHDGKEAYCRIEKELSSLKSLKQEKAVASK